MDRCNLTDAARRVYYGAAFEVENACSARLTLHFRISPTPRPHAR
jgi:hypothetical protein